MGQAIRRAYDIEGAPFEMGDCVRVTSSSDDTLDEDFLGKEGVVCYFEYDCGCGQIYPTDPMVGVEFPEGETGEFWKEELTRLDEFTSVKKDDSVRVRA